MARKLLASIALIGSVAWPVATQATIFTLGFEGGGTSGILNITYEPNPKTGPLPTTPIPNAVDPIGSFIITGVTGTLSDAALGLTDTAVTDIVGLNRVAPETTNLLAPYSFSLLPVANGVDEGGGIFSPGFHYDNLFYPGGSPQTASDYPFSGGVLDIYGMAFTLGNGDVVNLWSNGTTPGGLSYGVGITHKRDVLDYVDGVSVSAVPEASTWAMMIVGFGLAGMAMRRPRKMKTTVRFA